MFASFSPRRPGPMCICGDRSGNLILRVYAYIFVFNWTIKIGKKANVKKSMAKKTAPAKSGRRVINQWTEDDGRALKAHYKARTPVAAKISKQMKRTVGALRRRAGIFRNRIRRSIATVKKIPRPGQFLPWIEAEFGMSEDSARRFMNACKHFCTCAEFVAERPLPACGA